MQQVYAGTSGFSYKEWKGPFYPTDLPDRDFLSFYGTRLNSVEINNTFYRMPKRDVLRGWAEQTPEHFRFVIKASRRITHFKRLKEADEPMGFLIRNAKEMESKLGAVLFQLPPNLRANVERLKKFLDLIPDGFPAAMEFRHDSWLDDNVFAALSDHNVALCMVDSEASDIVSRAPPATANWCYARLRQPGYDAAALKTWTDFLAKSAFETSFSFFKHETDGAGPLMAEAFLASLKRRRTLQAA